MFNSKDIIGYIGNMTVVTAKDGVYLVDWSNGKRIFVPRQTEGEG